MKTAIFITGMLALTAALRAEDNWTIEPAKPSFTWQKDHEGIPKERDPMTPVDYVWPRPVRVTNAPPVQATKSGVQLSLTVEFISYTATEKFAKVTGFSEFLEEGKEYSFVAKGYKALFKVHRIEQTKIIVNFEGDLLEFESKTIAEELKGKTF
jgi:hypothetical protein